MTPTVTIIMATYNRAHLIVETLQSIQNQTFSNWECLIVDDGGTDNTLEVITPILKEDKRFQYLKRPNTYQKGLPGCRNHGLDLAKGEFVIFFDDDDIVHPQNLELCFATFNVKPLDFCVYEKQTFFNNSNNFKFNQEHLNIGKSISKHVIASIVMNEIPIASCAVMWRKECFLHERFNENLMYAEEWECYPRIISNNKNGLSIKNVLYFNRKHPYSNTGEFYQNDVMRVNSKKLAISLVVKNLVKKNLLSQSLLKYLAGFAITFRDAILLNDILVISKTNLKNRLYLKLKFYLFPLWKIYKRVQKKFSQ